MQKIREIEKDLGIYVNPSKSVQAETAVLNKETSPLFDLDKLRNELKENQGSQQAHNLIHTSHRSHDTPLQDVTNTS